MAAEGLQKFIADLQVDAKIPELAIQVIAQQTAIAAGNTLIQTTPVDTGHARANWQTALEAPPTGVLPGTDKTGDATRQRMNAVIESAPAFGQIIIANNVPYIERLDSGYSKQAPAGMSVLAEQVAIQTAEALLAEASGP